MADKGCRKKNVLSLQMFGGFSLRWQGHQIMGSPKNRDSQSACLMQLLLHKRREGVSRDQLERALFGDREIDDIRHAMRSVIYNTKRKLKLAGLPDCNYIRQENDVFYWTEKIPVDEDTVRFEQLILQAEKEGPEKRLDCLLEACDCYKGEFLPQQAGAAWAAREARHYQEQFFECVGEAVILLREKEDWQRMKELGIHAARVNPFVNWEGVTMEALIAMGQVAMARRLYEDTVDFYVREQGVRPSKKLLEQLAVDVHHHYGMLDAIRADLSEETTESEGGYLCTYPVFQGLYQMFRRSVERSGQAVYLMLCTLVDSKGNPMQEGAFLERLSDRMEKAVCSSVRRGDAVTRYSRGQYLALLLNTTGENCSVVQKRINERFLVGRQRTRIQYCVSCVEGCGQEGG